jgi:hypothetical protein
MSPLQSVRNGRRADVDYRNRDAEFCRTVFMDCGHRVDTESTVLAGSREISTMGRGGGSA